MSWEVFKMCFKFNRCLGISLGLNHTLCMAGQQDTTEIFVSVTRNLFFSSDLFFQSLEIPKQTSAVPNSCCVSPAYSCTRFPLTEHRRRKQSQLKGKAILQLLHSYFNKVSKAFGNLLFRTEGKWYTHTGNHSVWNSICSLVIIVTSSLKEDHFILGLWVGTYSEVRNHLFSRHFIISVD